MIFLEKFKSQQGKCVTPKRYKKSVAKNYDSQILTSLVVNMFDTPTSYTKKENQKRLLVNTT
jgi:hypothetical protein